MPESATTHEEDSAAASNAKPLPGTTLQEREEAAAERVQAGEIEREAKPDETPADAPAPLSGDPAPLPGLTLVPAGQDEKPAA